MKKPDIAGTLPTWPTTKKIPGKGTVGPIGKLPKSGRVSKAARN